MRLTIKKVLKSKLSFFTISHGLVHTITGSLAPVLPLIRSEFNLSYTLIGALTLLSSLTLGIASIPAGVISDRVNRLKFVSSMFMLIGILCALFLLATKLWIIILLFSFLFLCFSIFHPSAQVSLFYEYSCKRGSTFGIYESGGNFGMFLAPILAGFIGSKFGWRSVYGIWSVPAIIVALLAWFKSAEKGTKNYIYNSNKPFTKETFHWIRFVLAHRELRSIFIIQGIFGLLWAVVVFIPLFLVDKRGFSVEGAGLILALFLLGGVVGKIMGGKLCDKWGKKKVIISCFFLLGLFYPLIPFIFGFTLILVFLASSIIFFMIVPVLLTSVADFTQEGLGFNYGLLTLMGASFGSISRLFSGIISDIWGMEVIFFMFSIIALAGAVFSFFCLSS